MFTKSSQRAIAVLFLSSMSRLAYASLDCPDPSLHRLFDRSDAVLEVISVNAVMGWEGFRDSIGVGMEPSDVSDGYDRYVSEFPYDRFDVSDVYKGAEDVAEEILVDAARGEFRTGHKYVLFLKKVALAPNAPNDNLYIHSGCVFADLNSSRIVWNDIDVDEKQFTAFMNQLVFMKSHQTFSSSLPDIAQPDGSMERAMNKGAE